MAKRKLITPSFKRLRASFCDDTESASWDGIEAFVPMPVTVRSKASEDICRIFCIGLMPSCGVVALVSFFVAVPDYVLPVCAVSVVVGEFIVVSLCRFLARCWYLFPDEREDVARKSVALMEEECAKREAERKRKLDALRQECIGKDGSNRA